MVRTMDTDGFRKALEEKEIQDDKIEEIIKSVEELEKHLIERDSSNTLDSATIDDIRQYIGMLYETGEDTRDRLIVIYRYGLFIDNSALVTPIFELFDGIDVMDTLHREMGNEIGETKRDEIFKGLRMPTVHCKLDNSGHQSIVLPGAVLGMAL